MNRSDKNWKQTSECKQQILKYKLSVEGKLKKKMKYKMDSKLALNMNEN